MKYPPLRPEEQIVPLFSLLEENFLNLKEQYKHEKQTIKLKKIQTKLDNLLSILQSIDTALISNIFEIPESISKKHEKELLRLYELLETLDFQKYRGFYRRIKIMKDKILNKVIDLKNQLTKQTQKQKQFSNSSVAISLLPPRTQLNQLLMNLPAPPMLRRY